MSLQLEWERAERRRERRRDQRAAGILFAVSAPLLAIYWLVTG